MSLIGFLKERRTVVFVASILVLLLLVWFARYNTVDANAIRVCRTRYAASRTLADSMATDSAFLVGAQLERSSRTCGEFRLEGRLD